MMTYKQQLTTEAELNKLARKSQVGSSRERLYSRCKTCKDSVDDYDKPSGKSAALLTQQLRPISKFSGEEPDNESFEDWILQFEMIAEKYRWNAPPK